MQRIINDPNKVVEDMLKGFERCHKDIIHVDENDPRVVVSNFTKQKEKSASSQAAAVVINRPLSVIAAKIWSMQLLWEKSFLLRPQKLSMMRSVQLIRVWRCLFIWKLCR